ncbi:hypothetical protein FYK55_04045 [Roseiconus nitratireducens]|uniref:Elp3/MiaA/NifB-like radical SAM core domain-containing protein n=1 Tax=Roseiconus nitratireducens TaxID=2605748 RepID=A0A5M6DIM2_9BACT|nr:hypothetical protein [Roseiconus nitratireducens]KAA5546080.1 hypothetical protein FYK55_04045 [Roseiconus nitratireducens]
MVSPQNRPLDFLLEQEPFRRANTDVNLVDVSTIFLLGQRCPVGCAMCDLHVGLLEQPTPAGAIPNQIDFAQQRLPTTPWIKLYNGGNFFDPSGIPPTDLPAIADRCRSYDRVVVENHPRFGSHRHREFRDSIPGRLEVAVGLESVQPRFLDRINKRMTRDDFDRYARRLEQWDIDLRVFLIVGAPGLSIAESIRWARLSVRHAMSAGARHISLIPARSGSGWNGQAGALPQITADVLGELFSASLEDLSGPACLSVDLWGFQQPGIEAEARSELGRLESAIRNQVSL